MLYLDHGFIRLLISVTHQCVSCRLAVTVGCYTILPGVNHCGGALLTACCCIVIKGVSPCSDCKNELKGFVTHIPPLKGRMLRDCTAQPSVYLCVTLVFLFLFLYFFLKL